MIAVDTSVWIAFFRGRPAAVADALDRLIEADAVAMPAPVRIELLGGLRESESRRVQGLLGALPLWLPGEATWQLLEGWVAFARRKGERFGVGDLLIAAIAAEHEAPVWSLDADFGRLVALGLVEGFAD